MAMKPYYQNESVTLYHGDCFQILPALLSGGSGAQPPSLVDMVLSDPPYGIGACAWDVKIDTAALHAAPRPLCRRNAAKVFFADMRFACRLLEADPKAYRYDLVYWKFNPCGILNARICPLRAHGNILVFYDAKPVYNPQMWQSAPVRKPARVSHSENYAKKEGISAPAYESDRRFPLSVLYHGFRSDQRSSCLHPVEKPVGLLEWLVKTYTNEGETVLDPFAGSGSLGLAAMGTGRRAILIEREEKYCELAARRLAAAAGAQRGADEGRALPEEGGGGGTGCGWRRAGGCPAGGQARAARSGSGTIENEEWRMKNEE